MGFRWITGWVMHESYMGHTRESQFSHTLVTFSNATFLIFSKLVNLWLCHNLATLRIRKMNIVFDQSEESNPVLFLTSLLWLVISWFFALWLAFICWVRGEEEWGHQHEKRALNVSLRRHPKPLARPCRMPKSDQAYWRSFGSHRESRAWGNHPFSTASKDLLRTSLGAFGLVHVQIPKSDQQIFCSDSTSEVDAPADREPAWLLCIGFPASNGAPMWSFEFEISNRIIHNFRRLSSKFFPLFEHRNYTHF